MIKAVFFDLDDTLCDFQPAWEKAIWRALTEVANRTGISYDELLESWQSVWRDLMAELGHGTLNMVQVRKRRFALTFQKVSIEDELLAEEVDLLLGNEMLNQLRLFEDVDVLDRLRERHKLAIVTNGADDDHPDSQRSKAVRLGLLEKVDAFFASDAHGCRKPDPAFFLAAAQAMEVHTKEVLFVGDVIENDIVGANRAGMVSVLLWRGKGGAPELVGDLKPDYVISRLAELETIIG